MRKVVGVTCWQMVRERYFLRVIRIHVAESDEHDIEADNVHLHMPDLPPHDDAEGTHPPPKHVLFLHRGAAEAVGVGAGAGAAAAFSKEKEEEYEDVISWVLHHHH